MFSALFAKSRYKPDPPRTGGLFSVPFVKRAGMLVNNDTAMSYAAVFACVRAIAEPLSMLPWRAFRELSNGGKEVMVNSPVDRLLHKRPNPETSAMTFRQTLIAWALTWGNGYAEIERDILGRAVALWPIPPDRTEPMRTGNGDLIYKVSGSGDPVYIDAKDMYHIAGLGWDGITGYSILSLARTAIGLGLAAEEFGASFFANNTILGGVLEHPGSLSDGAYERLKTDWNAKHQGPSSAHKPAILEEGMKWQSIGIPPNDAQFLETRQHQVEDIARWFGVKPHKIGLLDRSIKANIESQNIEMVVDTLQPWAVRLEQEADAKLFSSRTSSSVFTKINLNSLMRGDSQARSEFYSTMASLGAFSVNDIIELEDGNPIGPDGDKRIVPMNMTTLEKIGEDQSQSQPRQISTQTDPSQDSSADQPLNEVIQIMQPFLADAILTELCYESRDFKKAFDSFKSADDVSEWTKEYFEKYRPAIRERFSKIGVYLRAIIDAKINIEVSDEVFDDAISVYLSDHAEQSTFDLCRVFDGKIDFPDFERNSVIRSGMFFNRFRKRFMTMGA